MNRIKIAVAVSVVAAFALPSAASAETYCVNVSGSDCLFGTPQTTIQQALISAASNGQTDLVKIGPKDTPYDEGQLLYQGAEKVDIVGAGPEKTVLRGSGTEPALTVLSPFSEVSNLGIEVPDVDFGAGLRTNAVASSLSIEYAGPKMSVRGAELIGSAVLEDSRISMARGTGVQDYGGGGALTVRDSVISGWTGITLLDSSAPAKLSRLQIRAEQAGISSLDGDFDAANVVVAVTEPTATGIGASGDSTARIAHATVVGAGGTGVDMISGGGQTATLELTDSAVFGFDNSLVRSGQGTPADLTARYSNFDSTSVTSAGPGTLSIAGNGNVVDVAPQFTAPDALVPNYQPLRSSPLVDSADPQDPLSVDLFGAARPRDGDGVDGARSDIGAFELDSAPPPGPDPGQPEDPAQPATPTQPARPAGPAVRIGPKALRLTRRGYARLRVSCPASAKNRCAGTLRLERKVRGSVRKAGARRFSVAAGRTATVLVRVSSTLRRSVRRKGVRVRVVARASDAVSASRTSRRTVTVKRHLARR